MNEYKKGKYTDKEIKIIEKMVEGRETIKDISSVLKRPYSSVQQKIKSLGLKAQSRYNSKYYYNIGDIVNGLKIIDFTRHSERKAYVVKSTTYKTAKEYLITEYSLKDGTGDAYVTGHRACEENCLWSNEEVRPHIIDVKEAKNITLYSSKPICFKCSNLDCKEVKKMSPAQLVRYGFSCQYCSIHNYYPETWFSSYNEIKKGKFIPQVNDLYKGYVFDFVDYENRIIVETHGEQHYKKITGKWEESYKKTLYSDEAKRNWCKNNNWKLIELDCRVSDFKFIMDNVNNEPLLPNVTTKDIEPMLKLIDLNKKYPIRQFKDLYNYGYSVPCIAKMYKTSTARVYGVLKRSNISMRDGGSYNGSRGSKIDKFNDIICKAYQEGATTNELAQEYECSDSTICLLLKRNNIHIRNGGESTKGKPRTKQYKKVKCVNSGIEFKSVKDASEKTGVGASRISEICNNKRKSSKGLVFEFIY